MFPIIYSFYAILTVFGITGVYMTVSTSHLAQHKIISQYTESMKQAQNTTVPQEGYQNDVSFVRNTRIVSEEDAALHYIDFQKPNWKTLFEKRIEVLRREYMENESIKLDASYEEYSDIHIHDTKQGFYLMAMHNVCFDLNRGGMNIYVQDEKDFDLSTIPSVFPSVWKFELLKERFPTNQFIATSPGSYIFIPHSDRNIAHFMEVFNFALHAYHQPHKYPKIDTVYYPTMEMKQIYLWIKEYKDVAMTLFPPEHAFENIYKEGMLQLTKSGMICYKRVFCPSRISYVFYGGIFISPTEVETVRAAAYKYYHLDPILKPTHLTQVMLMTRSKVAGNLPGRRIANQEELSMYLKESKEWLYTEHAMELLSPEEQIRTMLHTDILIGVLGSGFANMIYMLPSSVAMSFSPPYVGGFFFSSLAEFSQIKYIPVFNYSITPPNECNGLLGKYGEMKSKSEYCLSTLYTADIYFNIGTISSLMRQAMMHLHLFKYRK